MTSLLGQRSFPVASQLPFLFFLFFFFLNDPSNAQGRYPQSLPSEFHEGRREALRDSMKGLSMAAFFSAPARPRSQDIEHEYVQDRDLYYFTGLREKHSLLLIFSDTVEFDGLSTDELLFLPPHDPQDALWHGAGTGTEGAEDSLGIGKAIPNDSFANFELRPERFDQIHWMNDKRGVVDDEGVKGDLASLIAHFERKTEPLKEKRSYEELHAWTASMRERKEPEELDLLRRAIDITGEAHRELMRAMEPGMWEYQAEALVEHIFRANGCSGPGFPSIVGSGPNSCVLHYNRNGDRMDANELVVVDIGGEYGGYSADITRTLPVDGEFSEEERAIYELVLKAQKAAIEACQEGNRFWDPHMAAQQKIAQGLEMLGVIDERAQVQQYFMHGSSHYLGLDVHDVGSNGNLRRGTVLTVEPGVYIPEGSDCDERWWNLGVRIEDDILITEEGPENLSKDIPRELEKVEGSMEGSSDLPKFGKVKGP